ncbi:hypothetical protein Efla_002420 [Eimeria flavescens]
MATWDLRRKALTVRAGERKNTLNLEGCQTVPDKGTKDLDRQTWNKDDKLHAAAARNHMEDDIQRMGPQEAKALVTDSADGAPDSAAVKGAICMVLQDVTTKLELIGAALEQDGYSLGFLSKKMSEVEQPYAIYDQELLALDRALGRWRRLLLDAEVTAYTDHRGSQYLLQASGGTSGSTAGIFGGL